MAHSRTIFVAKLLNLLVQQLYVFLDNMNVTIAMVTNSLFDRLPVSPLLWTVIPVGFCRRPLPI